MSEFRQDSWQGIGQRPVPGGTQALTGRGRFLTDEALAAIYLDPFTRFARILVDRPAEDCTRRGWKIQVEESEDGVDPFAEEMKRLGVKAAFRRAHQKARLYGGAAILMVIDDDGALDEPVTGKVHGIKSLQVFSRLEIQPAQWYTDIEDPRFNTPEYYWLSPRSRGAAGNLSLVHADRVIRWEGLEVPEDFTYDYDGWGQSVIEAAYAALTDIDTAADSVREAVDKFQYNVLKLKGLQAILSGADGDDNSAFQSRIDWIEEGKTRTRHVVLDVDDEYEQISIQFTGLLDAYEVTQQNLSAVARMPITFLFGQSPSGLSTDDKSGTRNYYDGISAMQEDYYEPGLCRIVELLAQSGVGQEDGWSVVFHSLTDPDDATDATTKKTIAEMDQIYLQNGVITPEEARARFAVRGYSHDLVLSADSESEDTDAMYQRLMEIYEAANQSDTLQPSSTAGRPDGASPDSGGA